MTEFQFYTGFLQTSCIARLLTIRFLEEGCVATRLNSSLRKFYGRHHEFVGRYGISICNMKIDLFDVSQFSFPLSSTLDLTFYEQLGECFQKSRGHLPYRCTWSMFLVFSGVRVALFCYFECIILIFVVNVCFPYLVIFYQLLL